MPDLKTVAAVATLATGLAAAAAVAAVHVALDVLTKIEDAHHEG